MAGEKRVLTLGGKGSSLSSASVFEFSTASSPPLLLKIDPSALARLSSSQSSSQFKLQLSVPDYLTPEEARASVLLLLYKILIGGSLPASAASHLLDLLNKDTLISTIDLDFDKQENVDMLRNWWPDITVHAICALLDYTATSLAIVADAVAALSSDALEANISVAFSSFTDSGDGFSHKDRASVVSDLKVLLNGSTMAGKQQCDEVFSKIPIIHGRLRSLCKSVHSETRVELNSIPFGHGSTSEDLTVCFSPLADALKGLGEISWLRAKRCLEKLEEGNLFPSLVKSFNAGCPDVEKLEGSITSFAAFKKEKSYIRSLHEIYSLSETVRKILSWETMLSFSSLEGRDQKPAQQNADGVTAKSEKKNEKNKGGNKKVMGKGTNIFMQFLKDRLQLEKSKSGFPLRF